MDKFKLHCQRAPWMHYSALGLLLCGVLLLQACVTTTEGAFTKKANPEEAVARYVDLGLEYIKRNDLNSARRFLLRALEIDPDDASGNAALGLVYHEEAEARLAEKAFQKALDTEPGYTRGRTYYAAFLFSESRIEEALEQFQLAAEDSEYPSRGQVFANIALCHMTLGNSQAALDAYEKTLRLDRFNGRALSGATELLIETGDYQRAQLYYNRLVNLIKNQGLKHSAKSLWMGIRIARHYGSDQQAASLATLLENLYPDSAEYQAMNNDIN